MERPELVTAMFDLSTWHILVILIVALLLFGRRLPEIMRGLGSSVKEFKKGMNDEPTAAAKPTTTAAPATPVEPPQGPPGSVARDMSVGQPPPKV